VRIRFRDTRRMPVGRPQIAQAAARGFRSSLGAGGWVKWFARSRSMRLSAEEARRLWWRAIISLRRREMLARRVARMTGTSKGWHEHGEDDLSYQEPKDAWFSQRAWAPWGSGGEGNGAGEARPQSRGIGMDGWEMCRPFNVAGCRVTSCGGIPPIATSVVGGGGAARAGLVTSDGGAGWRKLLAVLGQSDIGRPGVRPPARSDCDLCATGEANISPDCLSGQGNGLYIIRDGGGTWEGSREPRRNHNLPRRSAC